MANNNDYNNIKNKNDFGKFYYLKKNMTQVLLCFSVLCFLYFQSSIVQLLVQSSDHNLSNISIKIFTYKSERNYVFLLFNGILVLIIRFSGLISEKTPQSWKKTGEINVPDQFQEEKVKTNKRERSVREESKNGDGKEEDSLKIESEDEWKEEGIEELMSRDELNKKCEDFIKKVKQEIR